MRETLLGGLFKVGRIGQGTFRFGGRFTADGSNDAQAVRTIRSAVDLGMNLIDTAEGYGAGHCEELIGRAIAGIRNRVVIATKFLPENMVPKRMVTAAERSLKRLGVDTIDLYQMHWPNYEVGWDEMLKSLEALVFAGKVRAIGLGNCSAGELRELLGISLRVPLVSCQNEYSLQERGVEAETLGMLKACGMALLAYSPFNQGKFPPEAGMRALRAVAEKHDRTPAQAILNWLCRHDNVLPIPQTGDERHLAENAAALDFDLDASDRERIDRAFKSGIRQIPTDWITIADAADRGVYKTLAEAVENRFGWTPSPVELSRTLRCGDLLKPVRLRRHPDAAAKNRYELVEGRVKYWAWVIAHEGKNPIPAIVENEEASDENE